MRLNQLLGGLGAIFGNNDMVETLLTNIQGFQAPMPTPTPTPTPTPMVSSPTPAPTASSVLCKYMEGLTGDVEKSNETIVHKKTVAILCLSTVKNEDKMEFNKIVEAIKANFNDEYRKKWGGGIMDSKLLAKTKAKERVIAKEAAQRMT